ncbi:MAG: HD domain-containing protein [Chthoniobacterales bacterium]|jgi:(p)ppGpp synthase/HD superfamily hydrolase
MINLVREAKELMMKAHRGQIRKYTGEPYAVHCKEVHDLVKRYGEDYARDPEVLSAALLHDVVEDTSVELGQISNKFGKRVARIVDELTSKYPRSTGLSRQERKIREAERLASVSPEAMAVKLADIAANVKGLAKLDPGFARMYLAEKLSLLSKTKGPVALWNLALERIHGELRQLDK